MSRAYRTSAWIAVSVTALVACTTDGDVFSEGTRPPPGTTTTTTTSTSSPTTTTTTTTTTATSTATSTGSGATGGTEPLAGAGGAGGSSSECGHPICTFGPPLASDCSDCVSAVCANDAYCCVNEWDYLCMDAALGACSIDCGLGLASCDSQYSTTAGYVLCNEGPTTCTIAFNNSQQSCAAYCAARGGECFTAYNNSGTCGFAEQLGCQVVGYQSAICICSRGCGAAPACAPGESCVSGQCG